jgi:hypothetical protein
MVEGFQVFSFSGWGAGFEFLRTTLRFVFSSSQHGTNWLDLHVESLGLSRQGPRAVGTVCNFIFFSPKRSTGLWVTPGGKSGLQPKRDVLGRMGRGIQALVRVYVSRLGVMTAPDRVARPTLQALGPTQPDNLKT